MKNLHTENYKIKNILKSLWVKCGVKVPGYKICYHKKREKHWKTETGWNRVQRGVQFHEQVYGLEDFVFFGDAQWPYHVPLLS